MKTSNNFSYDNVDDNEVKLPYMQLLEEINASDNAQKKLVNKTKAKVKKILKSKVEHESGDDEEHKSDDEIQIEDDLYSKEVLCKDNHKTTDENLKDGKS
jgi:hypothetical protein